MASSPTTPAKITFTVPAVLNPDGSGEKKIQLTVESLSDAFAKVTAQMGDDFKRRVLEADGITPRSLINVYINGKNAKFSDGINTVLQDGDEVYILPAVAGGSGDGTSSTNLNQEIKITQESLSVESNNSSVDTLTTNTTTTATTTTTTQSQSPQTSSSSTTTTTTTPPTELSSQDLDRFSRQIMLEAIGYEGQLQLKNSRICVVGTGGLGHPIISRLAAMGVGTLRIVDRDVVELSNLHRQTMFDQGDVGTIKVEAAAKKLKQLNPECTVEALAVSVNDYTALEVVEGCDVVIDALDSVNARYALNKACIQFNIPFVTGAAVGVSGQAFTVVPQDKTACYHCLFPALDEDTMPTCSIEGVHPSILSIVGGIEVAEAVKVILGKTPSLSHKMLSIDIDTMNFTSIQTQRVPECPVCGDAIKNSDKSNTASKEASTTQKDLILEELCGRNQGKRTFSITPTVTFELDVPAVTAAAAAHNLSVDNQGDLGLSLRNNQYSVSFMKRGSAVVVGPKDEDDAVKLYRSLLTK